VASPEPAFVGWTHTGTVVAGDGTPLAFASLGPPPGRPAARTLLCANGAGVSTFFWDYLARHFAREGLRVIVWDYRGHGASAYPEDLERLTIGACAEDLLRVLDAHRVEEAVLLGHSLGAQVILEAWRRAKDRVLGLVPTLGGYGRLADTFLHPRYGRALVEAASALGERAPELVALGFRAAARQPAWARLARRLGVVHRDLAEDRDLERYVAHLGQLPPEVFFRMVRAAQEHDAGPWLESVDAPTLVIAGEKDIFTPRELSLEMVRRMPRAELLEIPRGSHAALVEQPELVHLRVEKFLAGPVAAYAEQRARARTRATPGSA
jgi:pimeloyl-ACP methyl ester carboxylesterase